MYVQILVSGAKGKLLGSKP